MTVGFRYQMMNSVGCAPYLLLIILLFFNINSHATTILIVGDSLSAGYGIDVEEGWVNLLQQKLPQDTVINASISGDTTGAGLARLPLLLKQHQPDIVVIELGGNDGLQGFPLKVMYNNLTKMVTLALEANTKVLILGMRIPPNYGERYTEGFFNTFQTVAEESEISLMPFFIESVALEEELMQDDGIHPKAEAQPQLVEDMWPYIEPFLIKL